MRTQHGNFLPGVIVGFLLGVAIALAVALFVTRSPVPFVNKVPTHTAEQDAAEEARNRNWDPNAPIQGRNPARPHPPETAAAPVPGEPAASRSETAPAGTPAPERAASAAERNAERVAGNNSVERDPAAILADKPASASAADANLIYFVQTGAFARAEEAEQQRARLAMLGLTARVTEREQTGRTVYRVRLGPFNAREEAEATRERIAGNGLEAALVRVQR